MDGNSERTRVLLADGDERHLARTAGPLRAAGFEVTAVGDGNHAILAYEVAILSKRPYEVLLLDTRLPGATGWDVLSHVREHTPAGAPLPHVLMVTGSADSLDLPKGAAAGAEGILLKPFMNAALVAELRRHLVIPGPG
jgi:CheY-like chemotaxis protein